MTQGNGSRLSRGRDPDLLRTGRKVAGYVLLTTFTICMGALMVAVTWRLVDWIVP